MLANVNRTSGRVSWWLRSVLAAGGLAVLAAPVVYLSRVEPAFAQEAEPPGATEQTKDQPGGDKAEFVRLNATGAAEPAREFLPAPTESEERIEAVLQKSITLDFVETPLVTVVEYMKDALGNTVEFQLDNRALEDAGVGGDTPVTRHVKNVRAASGLKLMLDELDLTYGIRDDVVIITSKDREDTQLFTRIYPVSDLVGGPDPDYDALVDAITTTVLPATWDEVGGPGSIVAMPNSKSVVVSQTRQAQDEILQLLRALRAAKTLAEGK